MASPQPLRLDSWKAIADYLGRSVRTVIRWADERDLPIHRIPGGKRQTVFAYSNEIDNWLLSSSEGQQTTGIVEEIYPRPEAWSLISLPGGGPTPAIRPELDAAIPEPVLLVEPGTTTPVVDFWSRNSRWVLAGALLLICALGSIFVVTLHSSHARTSTDPRRIRIAVLPVQDLTGDHGHEVFADVLTDELITQLGGLNPQEMGVVARTSSMSFKNSDKTLAQISRELGVDYVLESNIRGSLNQFRFSAQLIRTRDQSPLWTQNYDRTSSNLLLLESELGRDIAREIGIHTTPEAFARRDRSLSVDPDSHLDYLQGRYYWNQRNQESLDRGFEYFKRAIEEDPKNARAFSGLADSYNMLVYYGYSSSAAGIVKAEESAQHALELDPSLAEAHASLGYVKFMWSWEWAAAEREFRRAIELDANYVPAHHWYALYLASMGRRAEADREIRTALNLDPFSSVVQSAAAYIHYFARDYDAAIQECGKVLQRDSNFVVAHSVRGLAYEGNKQYAKAISEFRIAEELSGGRGAYYKGLLGHAYAVSGNGPGARKILAHLNAMAIEGNFASQTSKAIIYAGLGERENALEALERARDQNDASLIWLRVDSRFDSLRADPQFQELLKAQGWSE